MSLPDKSPRSYPSPLSHAHSQYYFFQNVGNVISAFLQGIVGNIERCLTIVRVSWSIKRKAGTIQAAAKARSRIKQVSKYH
jgi:hypothetical protein